jgi:hypothetical protein
VVRPPTARSVSAICDAGVSAGWQHRKNSVSVSSTPDTGSGSGGVSAATVSSRLRLAVSLRHSSVLRRLATVTSHPRGLSGRPASGQCVTAAISASCTASSQVSKPPYLRTSAARTCGASSRSSGSISVIADIFSPEMSKSPTWHLLRG